MTWRTHLLVGVNALWPLAPLPNVFTPDTAGLLALAAGVGALLPDLDAARSKVRSLSIRGIQPLVPLSDALYRTFGHRGLLHSPLGWAGFGLLCLLAALWWGSEPSLGLFIGYGSHLLADSATPSGIPSTGLFPRIVQGRRLHLAAEAPADRHRLPGGGRVAAPAGDGSRPAPAARLAPELIAEP